MKIILRNSLDWIDSDNWSESTRASGNWFVPVHWSVIENPKYPTCWEQSYWNIPADHPLSLFGRSLNWRDGNMYSSWGN